MELVRVQGTVWEIIVRRTDSFGNGVDLRGCAALLQVRRFAAADDPNPPLLSLTETSGITLDEDGYITSVATDAQTMEINAGTYPWDLKVDFGRGFEWVRGGFLSVLPDVSRPVADG